MTTTLPAAMVNALFGPRPEGVEIPQPPSFDSIAEERQYRKEQLAAGLRIFGRFGFSEGVAGHITVRDPERPSEWFWVNPFGKSFSRIRASDLVLVDHEGHIVQGQYAVNRAALVIHSHVHAARPDAIAAAHAHSLHGKAFSSLGIKLAPITQDACAFYEDHGLYSEFGGVATEVDEGVRIGEALGKHKAVILQNHGLLTVGQSVAEAIWWFITLERSCQAQLLAMAAGTPKLIDHETALGVRSQVGTPFAGWFQARPLWDQITHSDPDLFN